ncbi:MAG: glycosyltransferase family 2 protein [Nitrospirae bacterium]|nr:glycosyltransferase family 2 protein [Nitrospirota bacterium]
MTPVLDDARALAETPATAPPHISYVIPLLNERPSLEELYRRIRAATEALGHGFEIVFVDDGSSDGSFDLIRTLHRADGRVRALRFGRNRGKSDALQAGFAAARGEIVVTMDADLQDDPDEVGKLLAALEADGLDLVSGWKATRHDPAEKRIFSKIFNGVTSRFSGVRLHDFNCGFKAYRRVVTDSFRVYGEMHRFLPVLAHWNGFRVGEVAVRHHPRRYGRSRFGASRIVKGLFDFTTVMFLVKFEKRPLHLFGSIGLACLALGGGISLWFVLRWLLGEAMYMRPIMIGGWVLMVIGIQFVSMGLLGEMLARAHHQKAEVPIRERLG